MFHIRTVETSSGATAVQVVFYENRKMCIASHIGSAHDKKELAMLKKCAADWIKNASGQRSLFLENDGSSKLISLDKCRYLGIRHLFVYEALSHLFERFRFHLLPNSRKILLDLALIRIIEPASKLRSFELLQDYFGRQHNRKEFYRYLKSFAGLAVCKYMEIKTGEPISRLVKSLKSITDARILNLLTKKKVILRSEITDDVKIIMSKLNLSY